eukprot:3523628-Pleurochrysis_carterae.AAC.2
MRPRGGRAEQEELAGTHSGQEDGQLDVKRRKNSCKSVPERETGAYWRRPRKPASWLARTPHNQNAPNACIRAVPSCPLAPPRLYTASHETTVANRTVRLN